MELAINYQPTNYATSIKLAKGKVSGLSAVLGAAGPDLFCPSFTPPDVGAVTNVRTEKAKICQIFLCSGRDPHREPWAAQAGLKQRFVPGGAAL